MIISILDVRRVFQAVIDGQMSREDADLWASDVIKNDDNGDVVYVPIEDEPRIWSGIMYLLGIDLLESPIRYVHLMEDILLAYREKLGE